MQDDRGLRVIGAGFGRTASAWNFAGSFAVIVPRVARWAVPLGVFAGLVVLVFW